MPDSVPLAKYTAEHYLLNLLRSGSNWMSTLAMAGLGSVPLLMVALYYLQEKKMAT